MRIFMIGGTRLMGPYIVNNLYQAGHEVIIFHRGQTPAVNLPEGVEEILGDRNHLVGHASALRSLRPDVVLDMAIFNETQARDLMLTFAGAAKRIVMISSQDVYAAFGRVNGHEPEEVDSSIITESSPLRKKLYPHRGDKPRAEDDPQRWLDDYDKIPAERIVTSNFKLPGTILRLPAVYGPLDYQHRMYLFLKRMLDKRPAILLEEDVAHWRWTHGYVENVADAIVLAVTDERASGRIYNVGEPLTLSMKERIEAIARVVDWHGRIITLPAQRLPAGNRWGINAAQNVIVDSSLIRQELGYKERIEPDEAMRRTIAWERDNPPEKSDPDTFDYAAEDAVLAKL